MNTSLKNLFLALVALLIPTAAFAEDLLGNTATAGFDNLRDTQSSMAPLILGVVGFTVVLGLAIKWLRKAG